MINIKKIQELIGKYVKVGVEHYDYKSRLFYYSGLLVKVDDFEITLDIGQGIRIIPVQELKLIQRISKEECKLI